MEIYQDIDGNMIVDGYNFGRITYSITSFFISGTFDYIENIPKEVFDRELVFCYEITHYMRIHIITITGFVRKEKKKEAIVYMQGKFPDVKWYQELETITNF